MDKDKDGYYMGLAMKLARKGVKATRPNPMVGALIVKNNKIVGQGYHHRFGAEHAEVLAIRQAGQKARGATLYVNLEPCNHYGQTPPCTEAIILAGIKRVVAAVRDPNPLTSGQGIKRLNANGIEVITGVREQEARRLNEVFFKYIVSGYPFTILKMAVSIDGKVATRTGDSKWITSIPARTCVHQLRSQVDAIMVGVNTVSQDDPYLLPYLTSPKSGGPVRDILAVQEIIKFPGRIGVVKGSNLEPLKGDSERSERQEGNPMEESPRSGCPPQGGFLNNHLGNQPGSRSARHLFRPIRIIVDSYLRSPYDAKIFRDAKSRPVIIATIKSKFRQKIKKLTDRDVELIFTSSKNGHVDLKDLFRKLGDRGISLIMVEGGPGLATSLLEEKLIDKIIFFVSPKIIGGQEARTPVEGRGVTRISDALNLKEVQSRRIGDDILIEGYPDYHKSTYRGV